jgi:hypothetical protein
LIALVYQFRQLGIPTFENLPNVIDLLLRACDLFVQAGYLGFLR